MNIAEAYNKLTQPDVFVTTFDSNQEFKQWCEDGTKKDLECTLIEFTKYELYEYCSIISEVLKSK